jgi:hypothetical protein
MQYVRGKLRSPYRLLLVLLSLHYEYGVSMIIRNVGEFLQEYTALNSRSLLSSKALPYYHQSSSTAVTTQIVGPLHHLFLGLQIEWLLFGL